MVMVMVVQPCASTKNHGIVHLERMNFMICELVLNFFKKETSGKTGGERKEGKGKENWGGYVTIRRSIL